MSVPVTPATAEAFDPAGLPAGVREALRVLGVGGALVRVQGGWRARNGRRFRRDTVGTMQALGLVERGAGARPLLVLTEAGKALADRLAGRKT